MRLGHLVASFNDYRHGDVTCGALVSLVGRDLAGQHRARMASLAHCLRRSAPVFPSCGDTAVAWDTKGNATCSANCYAGSGSHDNPDASSAVYVFASTGNPRRLLEFHRTPVLRPDFMVIFEWTAVS